MRCNKCKAEYPFDIASAPDFDCLVCSEGVWPTAEDYVSQPILGLAREVRPTQVDLTKLIDQAIFNNSSGIFEAGTGVGKSYAYLLAAILNRKRTIVSTAKKSLQSQLYEKDLPALAAVLAKQKQPFKFALALGRSNYICRHALPKTKAIKAAWDGFFDQCAPPKPGSTRGWWTWDELATYTKKPDVNKKHLAVLKYSSEATAERCVGAKCTWFKKSGAGGCTYVNQKEALETADVVVTNHWLLGYHLRLREEQQYELLGPAPVVIVDEAHKIEDGIRTAFTDSISENFLNKLFKKYDEVVLEDAFSIASMPEIKSVLGAWNTLFNEVDRQASKSSDTLTDVFVQKSKPLWTDLQVAVAKLAHAEHQKSLFGFSSPLSALLSEDKVAPAWDPPSGMPADKLEAWYTYTHTCEGLHKLIRTITDSASPDTEKVTYIERDNRSGERTISVSPVDVSKYLRALHLQKVTLPPANATGSPSEVDPSVVYLSATLAIAGQFDVFATRVGIPMTSSRLATGLFGSAFDLAKQATLYIPKTMPLPDRGEGVEKYRDSLAEEIFELVEANRGNAFVLFTARDEMLDVAARLSGLPNPSGKPRQLTVPMLIQDGVSAADLLKQYRRLPNAALFGLKSFWEGVDVAGEKLSLVIITKLPFPGRNDAIVNARRRKAGDLWFPHVDIPDMIFDLRQGLGRLIRTTTDTGVAAILDARVLSKSYGRTVLKSSGFKTAQTSRTEIIKIIKNRVVAQSVYSGATNRNNTESLDNNEILEESDSPSVL